MRNCFLGLGVVALVVSSFGCAKTTEDVNPVTGKITYDGKPLVGARIRLEATSGTASRVYACDSKEGGTFDIEATYSTATLKGAPVGSYKVLVGKFKKEKHLESVYQSASGAHGLPVEPTVSSQMSPNDWGHRQAKSRCMIWLFLERPRQRPVIVAQTAWSARHPSQMPPVSRHVKHHVGKPRRIVDGGPAGYFDTST